MKIESFLKSYKMLGQIWPVSKMDTTEPVIALLVPVDIAMKEYSGWSGEEVTKYDFIKSLKDSGVCVFKSLDEFVRYRDNLKGLEKIVRNEKKVFKRNISEERRNQLKEHAASIRAKKTSSISQNA